MDQQIQTALDVLRKGGTILYPTDTVWGIGCDATKTDAVARIFEIKKRVLSKSLVVLMDNDQMLNRYVNEVPDAAWELIELSEAPLTIVYDDVRGLAPLATTDDHSAAIRITNDEFCRKLIHKLGRPLISTSANVSEEKTPGNFREISAEIKSNVDYIVDWRQEEQVNARPSSIIQLKNNGVVKIIRK